MSQVMGNDLLISDSEAKLWQAEAQSRLNLNQLRELRHAQDMLSRGIWKFHQYHAYLSEYVYPT